MPRQLAVAKRVSLEGIADGWTEQAYALIIPASYKDRLDTMSYNAAGHTNEEQIQFQLDFTKKRVVSGKVFVLDETGALVIDDYQAEDLEASNALLDRLFLEINGITLDPKDLPTSTSTETSNLSTTLPTNEPLAA